jgi:hypothetical protein
MTSGRVSALPSAVTAGSGQPWTADGVAGSNTLSERTPMPTPDRLPAGTSRRRFLQWSALAGAGAAAARTLTDAGPATAAPAQPTGSLPSGALPQFAPLRAPAAPLAVRSPYLSTWLPADSLPGTWPTFWTGHITAMTGIARIDGTAYVFLGNPALPNTNPLPTMRQTSTEITATHSRYVLQKAGVELTVSFFSPVEPGDLRRQSMPLSYVTATARSLDGSGHRVSLYFDISGEWTSGDTGTHITWDESAYTQAGTSLISLTNTAATPQPLREIGNMAAWGAVVWSTAARAGLTWQIGQDAIVRGNAVNQGSLDGTVDQDRPRAINDRWPVFAFNLDLGAVRNTTDPLVFSIGHVREPAVSYLGDALPPLWRSYFDSWQAMVGAFHADHADAEQRASMLDQQVTADGRAAASEQYAALCALALRQAYGGTELVSRNGKPWAFLKEISSDGNVSTVDVTYPCMPAFLYTDPSYLGLILEPLLDYAENGGWPKVFAEHDLGSSYPNATGHNDGNEEDMPVEESANMLIMCAARAAHLDGTARTQYATGHYRILKQWADYLVDNALDPGFQNQTDDFTGFIAHSVNLALKGIVGIGAMSRIATAAGQSADADHYLATARSYIAQWAQKAADSSGEHLKLAYDQDGTWSLKYNGYPDRLLGLDLVPDSIATAEAAWYLSRANTYGVPLDLRHTYTKGDWEMWTAAWLSRHQEARDLLIESVYEFADTSPSRVPMTDWYDTVSDRQAGFQARPVVGGFFALLTLG